MRQACAKSWSARSGAGRSTGTTSSSRQAPPTGCKHAWRSPLAACMAAGAARGTRRRPRRLHSGAQPTWECSSTTRQCSSAARSLFSSGRHAQSYVRPFGDGGGAHGALQHRLAERSVTPAAPPAEGLCLIGGSVRASGRRRPATALRPGMRNNVTASEETRSQVTNSSAVWARTASSRQSQQATQQVNRGATGRVHCQVELERCRQFIRPPIHPPTHRT